MLRRTEELLDAADVGELRPRRDGPFTQLPSSKGGGRLPLPGAPQTLARPRPNAPPPDRPRRPFNGYRSHSFGWVESRRWRLDGESTLAAGWRVDAGVTVSVDCAFVGRARPSAPIASSPSRSRPRAPPAPGPASDPRQEGKQEAEPLAGAGRRALPGPEHDAVSPQRSVPATSPRRRGRVSAVSVSRRPPSPSGTGIDRDPRRRSPSVDARAPQPRPSQRRHTAASPAPPSAASAPSPPPAAAAPLAPSAGGFRVQLPTRAGFRVRPPTQSRRLPSPAAACFCPPASGGHLLFNLYSSLIHISTFLISFWGRLKNILCTPK